MFLFGDDHHLAIYCIIANLRFSDPGILEFPKFAPMAIFLIRHTTPLIEKGICYGQLNIDVTESFEAEAGKYKKPCQ